MIKKFLLSDTNYKSNVQKYLLSFKNQIESDPNISFLKLEKRTKEYIEILMVKGTLKKPFSDEEIQNIKSKLGMRSDVSVSSLDQSSFKPKAVSFGSKFPSKK